MSYEFNEQEEEFIRPPDQVIREQLISRRTESNIESDMNADIRDVLEQSMMEYAIAEIEKQEQMEIENMIREQQENRKKSIENFMKKLNNLTKFDTKANEVKELIQPIIDKYIDNDILETDKQLDENSTKKVKDFMRTIRISSSESSILEKIIK